MSQPEPRAVVERLLAHYRRHARDLPWRRDPSPWSVLLSEAMLQQTRVETVLEYHRRFLERWPTLEAFADAEEQEVLRAWSGLGYYARARNLSKAARAAVAAGGLPSTAEALVALPGIGPYTAGAVASIAFGQRTPVVDGNVERVMCRLDRRTTDPRREGRTALWARVAELHEALAADEHAGDLNQALMELGATVCVPRNPRCGACPLGDVCVGRADAATLPVRAPKKPPREVLLHARVLRSAAGTFLVRRPDRGLFAGMWEPPMHPPGVALPPGRAHEPVTHVLTHRRLTVVPFVATGDESTAPALPDGYVEGRWVADPASVPLSVLARRLLSSTAGGSER